MRKTVMSEIDEALADLPKDAVDIDIQLNWPHYRDLLAVKGLDTDAGQIATWGSGYDRRPLKDYRGHALKYTQYCSLVIASRPDGTIIGELISYDRD